MKYLQMKSFKRIYGWVLVIATLAITSCSYLDVVPDNVATIDHAFSDRYTAETYLATCYWGLPKIAGLNENPAFLGGGDLILNKEHRNWGGMARLLGYDSPTIPLCNHWDGDNYYIRSLYAGINDCNTFLANIENVHDLSSNEKKRWTAEVKLIKAYEHFFLITYYGPICPLKENTPVNASTQGVRTYREKVDDCFAYVFELLNEVIEGDALPMFIDNKTTEAGRFTKAVAYTLKAKVLMFWASPFFNGNTDYNAFLDHNGEHFFNQTYDPGRWQLAADACKEAIAICERSGIRLYQQKDYTIPKSMSDTTLRINALRSAVTERWNCESIWANSSYPANYSLQVNCFVRLQSATGGGGEGIISIPLHFVDKFYSQNGVPIDEDTRYNYAGRFAIRKGDADHRYYIHQAGETAAMNFEREPRFYSTLGFDRGKWYGNSWDNYPENDANSRYPDNRFNGYSSIVMTGVYNATGYFLKKLVSMETTYTTANSVSWFSYPFPDLRYASLLLYYAEALNEVKAAPDEEVYAPIDSVRARAGLEGVVDSWMFHSNIPDKPLTKNGMREIIQRERTIELAGEAQHYWDIIRWKTAIKELNARNIQGWNVFQEKVDDYYSVTTIYTLKFSLRDYLAPIPENELLKNPLLIQNPGW